MKVYGLPLAHNMELNVYQYPTILYNSMATYYEKR